MTRNSVTLGKIVIGALVLSAVLGPGATAAAPRAAPLIIDHLRADLGKISAYWIDEAQAIVKWHYVHTSHGGQLVYGLDAIEAADQAYDVETGENYLPDIPGALCLYRAYGGPADYCMTSYGMTRTRGVLRDNPRITLSGFSWCGELETATAGYVQAYLDSMTRLEEEFPNVTFFYMTGNAQVYSAAANRTRRNQQIREYCALNNKVLYDFEDLDCWWFNPVSQEWEQGTITDAYGDVWPVQHTRYDGDVVAHTTWESCMQKGKAVWWMAASIAGWDGSTAGVEDAVAPRAAYLAQNYPNPFNPVTRISFGLTEQTSVSLRIYDAAGRLVRVLAEEIRAAGIHSELWDGKDDGGAPVASGIYFCLLKAGTLSETRKMILLK